MKNKRLLQEGLFAFLLLSFLIYFSYKYNVKEIIKTILTIDYKYVILGLVLMSIFVICEALNIKNILETFKVKVSFFSCWRYSLIGFFFSSITPSQSGGQPLQIYFMKKDGIDTSISIITLIVVLVCFQFLVCIFAVMGFLMHYDFLITQSGTMKLVMLGGFLLNLFLLIFLLFVLGSKKFSSFLMFLFSKFLIIIHFKAREKIIFNLQEKINDYHDCAKHLKQHKILILKLFLITGIQLFSYYSIPYLVYLAFGFYGKSYFSFVFMQAFLYAAVSAVPMPGAMGVHEEGFLKLFIALFPVSILASAMVVSRAISFYLYLLIAGLAIILFRYFPQKEIK